MGNSELFKTALVSKKNILNEMKAENLTLQQIRFLIIYLSKINPLDESTRTVKFKLSSFQKIMEFGKLNTKRLKQSTDALQSIKVSVPRNTKNGYESIVLFSRCLVDKDSNGEWFVEMSASVEAMQYMFNLNKEYVKYQLWNILDLKSKHQFRMYEILKQHENQGKIEITIEKLRALLGIKDNQYQRFTHLRERVLEPCQKALKEKTDIYFDFEKGKSGTGREWRTIIFKIHPNIAKKALIESTAKEIKNERVDKPNESVNKPNETTTTTQPKYNGFKEMGSYPYSQPKYNGFKEKGLYPYSNKPYTPRKKPGLPSFEYKQWNLDDIQKIIDKSGADDEDDLDYDIDSNSKNDIDIDNLSDDEIMALVKDVSRVDRLSEDNSNKLFSRYMQIIEETGDDDEDEDISNKDSNSKKEDDIDIDKLSDDELKKIDFDTCPADKLSKLTWSDLKRIRSLN